MHSETSKDTLGPAILSLVEAKQCRTVSIELSQETSDLYVASLETVFFLLCRWDDVVFKNCAKSEPKNKVCGFILVVVL